MMYFRSSTWGWSSTQDPTYETYGTAWTAWSSPVPWYPFTSSEWFIVFFSFLIHIFQRLLFFQGHTHRPKAESRQTPSCSQAAQNGEPRTRVKGCVRLCCDLSEKCVQHSHCLHAIPPHLCHGGRATLQRQVLLLQRWIQAQRRRVSVSWYSMWFLRNYTA